MDNFHLPNDIVLMILNCVVAKPATKHLPREFAKRNKLSWDPIVGSDIPGIVMFGGQSHVKSVFFEVNTRESPLKLLGALVRDLQHTGVAWTGVKALHFRFCKHSVAIRGYVPIVFNKNASDDILKLAADLVDRFPNVLELHTESLNSNVAISALVRHLVDKFAVTVTSLNHNLFYPISVPAFSDTLAHLSLIMSPWTVGSLPRVNADALKTLKLRSWLADYSWTSFANGQTSGSTSFAQLKKLSIGFLVNSQHTETDNGGSELGHSFQMSFPALEYLRLDNWTSDIKEISTALFPAYIPNIHVSGSIQAIKSFFWHKFSGFGNFKIGIECCDATDIDTFYETTNIFFNLLRIDGQAALDLVFDCYELDPNRINWTNLTFLTISVILI
ncbi:hypothetical protein BX661DRAFT_170230 [Kickxella alabastrina]|uniref:uncharacterized protein n=1 Tax=Kickxella alabastrina TaxID=61397 RepID=UPI00221F25F9|nr:uncharacterized protein BX661DRAFT_170230 [Kickxella alabastrina]KAI7831053.1 hypothetical protein BX661DRAFT_170230 [Kickxella alabastrina]